MKILEHEKSINKTDVFTAHNKFRFIFEGGFLRSTQNMTGKKVELGWMNIDRLEKEYREWDENIPEEDKRDFAEFDQRNRNGLSDNY